MSECLATNICLEYGVVALVLRIFSIKLILVTIISEKNKIIQKHYFCKMSSNGQYNYDGTSSSSDTNSGYSGYSMGSDMSGVSHLSTSTTYGTYGSWTGGDTHASGYDADIESNCSYK